MGSGVEVDIQHGLTTAGQWIENTFALQQQGLEFFCVYSKFRHTDVWLTLGWTWKIPTQEAVLWWSVWSFMMWFDELGAREQWNDQTVIMIDNVGNRKSTQKIPRPKWYKYWKYWKCEESVPHSVLLHPCCLTVTLGTYLKCMECFSFIPADIFVSVLC